jgi:hypothetical protein
MTDDLFRPNIDACNIVLTTLSANPQQLRPSSGTDVYAGSKAVVVRHDNCADTITLAEPRASVVSALNGCKPDRKEGCAVRHRQG